MQLAMSSYRIFYDWSCMLQLGSKGFCCSYHEQVTAVLPTFVQLHMVLAVESIYAAAELHFHRRQTAAKKSLSSLIQAKKIMATCLFAVGGTEPWPT
jgi:hypothetical protein